SSVSSGAPSFATSSPRHVDSSSMNGPGTPRREAPVPCPSPKDLAALREGRLDAERMARVAAQLPGGERCRDAPDALVSEGTNAPGAGSSRCPFCHDTIVPARDKWVACVSCLARHHASCWYEAK